MLFNFWSLFCNAVLSILSSFTIILLRKRYLDVLLKLFSCSYGCSVCLPRGAVGWYMVSDCGIYQSRLILTALSQHDLINVSFLTACYLYQVMMTSHFFNDVAHDAESTQK